MGGPAGGLPGWPGRRCPHGPVSHRHGHPRHPGRDPVPAGAVLHQPAHYGRQGQPGHQPQQLRPAGFPPGRAAVRPGQPHLGGPNFHRRDHRPALLVLRDRTGQRHPGHRRQPQHEPGPGHQRGPEQGAGPDALQRHCGPVQRSVCPVPGVFRRQRRPGRHRHRSGRCDHWRRALCPDLP